MNNKDFTKISESGYLAYQTNQTKSLYLRVEVTKNGNVYYKIDTLNSDLNKKLTQLSIQFFKSIIKSKLSYYYADEAKKIINQLPETSKAMKAEVSHSIKIKFKRAVEKAKLIGRGLVALKKQGIKGTILNEAYWSEAIDPQHKLFKNHKVRYLKNKQRKQFKLNFENGAVKRNGRPFDTSTSATSFSGKGVAIFVVDPKKNFYSSSHKIGQFHHSSLIAGGAILGAGECMTNMNGEFVAISNKSGHYKPNIECMINVLSILKEQGIDLSKIVLVLLEEKKSFGCNALEFLEAMQTKQYFFKINIPSEIQGLKESYEYLISKSVEKLL